MWLGARGWGSAGAVNRTRTRCLRAPLLTRRTRGRARSHGRRGRARWPPPTIARSGCAPRAGPGGLRGGCYLRGPAPVGPRLGRPTRRARAVSGRRAKPGVSRARGRCIRHSGLVGGDCTLTVVLSILDACLWCASGTGSPRPSYHRSGATGLRDEDLGRVFTRLCAVAALAKCTRAVSQ
jgi:hypothetical protein